MKRILITGANSYVGTSFEKWMKQFGEEYRIDTLDMQDENWRKYDFSGYDSVFHVAAIVHVKEKNSELYYKVNRDLAVEVASLAKNSGVKQFVFFSTMAVYGMDTGEINRLTQPNPKTHYGKSKYEAEKSIEALENSNFLVTILRPPMIYGEGCKGNYQQLVKIAKKLPIFPNVKNKRSMLSIWNLCIFVKDCVDNNESGIFFPQDPEYIRTSYMVRDIAKENGKKIYLFYGLNWMIYLLGYCPGKIGRLMNKAFGSLVYQKAYSGCRYEQK